MQAREDDTCVRVREREREDIREFDVAAAMMLLLYVTMRRYAAFTALMLCIIIRCRMLSPPRDYYARRAPLSACLCGRALMRVIDDIITRKTRQRFDVCQSATRAALRRH